MKAVPAGGEITVFEGLETYSRAEVELLNWFYRSFPNAPDWRAWVQDGLGSFLPVPAGTSIHVKQTRQVEDEILQNYHFEQDRVGIGREPDNDIVLSQVTIGRHHARILKRHGSYLLEDLGSSAGTYLNGKKLEQNSAVPLQAGDTFMIFPHQFEVSIQEIWDSEPAIQLTEPKVFAATWRAWETGRHSSVCRLAVKVHPAVGVIPLTVNRAFLDAVVHRLTRLPANHLVASDAGLFELLLLCALEPANCKLKFPFQFSLIDFERLPDNEQGIGVECSIGLSGATGVFRFFLPVSLLTRMQLEPGRVDTQFQKSISWRVFAMLGYADLSLSDLSDLEVGDVLVPVHDPTLLLPSSGGRSERGWQFLQTGERQTQLQIQSYFTRSTLMPNEEIGGDSAPVMAKPDLTTLPVRLHVVLGQVEMSLAELNTIVPGSIVELNREKSEPVQIAINGKIAGRGDLIEVEGKLGVRITGWTFE